MSRPGRLLALVDAFQSTRVGVFGDLLADEFIYGEVSRVSREAPVLILEYDSTEIVPGGAGNAAKNVAALGGPRVAIGAAGRDDTGRRLLEALAPRVNVTRRRAAGRLSHADQDPHPCRRRPLGQAAGRPHRSRDATGLSDAVRAPLEASVARAARERRALLVSDYGTGLVARRGCRGGARRGPQRPRQADRPRRLALRARCGFAA